MQSIQPIRPRYHLQVLSVSELNAIRSATLCILHEVGVQFPSRRALSVFADHGAQVDWQSSIVRLSPELVTHAMGSAPREYVLAGRAPGTELLLNGSTCYFGTADCGTLVADFETGAQRASCKNDIARMARVADYLPSIAFYWPLVSAQEYGTLACLHELEAAFKNTVKHVQTQTLKGETLARYAVRMGEIVAGDRERMRRRPPFSIVVCSIPPLGHDKEGVEAAMVYAEAGIPVGFMSLPNIGSTAPATVGGALVVGTAEIISALVLLQLVAPGAAVFFSLSASVMDPHTAAYLVGMPQRYICNTAAVQIAHHWGVPVLASVFNTDSLDLATWRLGRDSVYNALMVALAGADLAQGLGMLKTSTLLVPEQIIFDDEIYHTNRIVAEGVDVSTDGLALDAIRNVGPRGHFLLERHTRHHFRELWIPELSYPRRVAQSKSATSVHDQARAKLADILETHVPQPLDESAQSEFESLLNAAAKEIGISER